MVNLGKMGGLMSLIGMAKSNPQQAVMQVLQQAFSNGRVNQQQYQMLANGVQSGMNPNQIIQQMLNSGMVSQQQYETARQGAGMFNR